ncbi:hypothetical protein [Thiorhodovibrio frisius]|uniref:Uncharacterized protein n=1 Tax=Thiorhodovibrio frisius TaxID=631362 RepID=H8Z6U1_9GAMM|nr:hypothetical protein [Thiorhodovibrio frisius]EIC20807.1 hypothetical protein Thi970DRAFT_04470 [Thiorhodovibrio frisius]WPL21858.1 hypothetical protein Thiofri_01995 [Thiorhodovibrio frisius]
MTTIAKREPDATMAGMVRLARLADAHQSEIRAALEAVLDRLERIESKVSTTPHQPQEGTRKC